LNFVAERAWPVPPVRLLEPEGRRAAVPARRAAAPGFIEAAEPLGSLRVVGSRDGDEQATVGALVPGALGLGSEQVGLERLFAMRTDLRFAWGGHAGKVAAPPLLTGFRERI
jgi:hypothetical protein